MSTAADLPSTGPGLRLRQPGVESLADQDMLPSQPGHSRESSDANADANVSSDKASKTYGRTPDGTGTL